MALLLTGAFAQSANATVSITNFSPVSSTTIAEGSSFSISISVTSTRILDGFSGSVAWGDGDTTGVGGFSVGGASHLYADDGFFSVSYSGTGFEHDFGGFLGSRRNFSNAISSGTINVTVTNVAPTVGLFTESLVIDLNDTLIFGTTASDPGVNDLLTFLWDLDDDGQYDDFTGQSGSVPLTPAALSISPGSEWTPSVMVSDGDGGQTIRQFNIAVVPEPGSATLAMAGALFLFRRRRKR